VAARRKLPGKRNGIAAALKSFTPKIVKAKKGGKAYRRKTKHPSVVE
jgi:stalled ribosome alternative rescue factor ArfA